MVGHDDCSIPRSFCSIKLHSVSTMDIYVVGEDTGHHVPYKGIMVFPATEKGQRIKLVMPLNVMQTSAR